MPEGRATFYTALVGEFLRSMPNRYGSENWDAERFGPHRDSLKGALVTALNQLLAPRLALTLRNNDDYRSGLSKLESSLDGLSSLYNRLADDSSRAILVKVIAYRILSYRRVKLPLNTADYWSARKAATALIRGDDTLDPEFRVGGTSWALRRFHLGDIGYPIELFFSTLGVFNTFMLKQYEYQKRSPIVKVREGDYVIDGGGCWGDTALYFASAVGAEGRVFSFEFTPPNLKIFAANMALNPELSARIQVVPHAMWDHSGEHIGYDMNGPGTSLANDAGHALSASTMSVDDFVKNERIARVDFIKMDIEGAELKALRGAEATIRSWAPTLAISVYHKEDDLLEIPAFLDSLGGGYDLFLDHYTIYGEETVLFAVPQTVA